MNVAPRFVKRADLQHDQIERAEALMNLAVFGGETGIAAEENGVLRPAHDQRRPERGIAGTQTSTREMLRRRSVDRQPRARHVRLLPPIELGDALGRNAPGL